MCNYSLIQGDNFVWTCKQLQYKECIFYLLYVLQFSTRLGHKVESVTIEVPDSSVTPSDGSSVRLDLLGEENNFGALTIYREKIDCAACWQKKNETICMQISSL